MVSESLTLTFNLLTGYYSSLAFPSSLQIDDVILWELQCVGVSGFCVFLADDSTDLQEIFFQGLGENA